MDQIRTQNSEPQFKPDSQLLDVPDSPKIREIRVREHVAHLPENQFFVYSPTSMRAIGLDPSAYAGRSVSERDTSILFSDLQKVQIPDTCTEITVFGAGRAIDIGKYLGWMRGKPVHVIPSLLSTNAFGTPFGCYEGDGDDKTKTTLQTGYPANVLVDFDYLKELDSKNLFGLADVLSISTALHDWDLAKQQNPSVADDSVYNKAHAILRACLKTIDDGALDTRALFNLIINSAYITGLHGSGRPESGSEHIFSKFVELDALRKGEPIMHGISVGLGILLMATLQGNKDTDKLFATVRRLGLLAGYAEKKEELKQLAARVLTQLEPHAVRYSIVNQRINDLHNPGFAADLAHEVVEKAFAQPTAT